MRISIVQFKEVFEGYTGIYYEYREHYIPYWEDQNTVNIFRMIKELNVDHDEFIEQLQKYKHIRFDGNFFFLEESKRDVQAYFDSLILMRKLEGKEDEL